MTNIDPNQRRFEDLITDIAERLMAINAATVTGEIELALSQLLTHFRAEVAVLRRHDQTERRSHLVAHRTATRRAGTTNFGGMTAAVDPLGPGSGLADDAAFCDEPLLAISDRRSTPMVTYIQGDGVDRSCATLATIPLSRDGETIGVLGLTHRGKRRWHDDELRALSSVAALLASLWSRIEQEQLTAEQMHYDELTGLPNRRKLSEAIDALDGDVPVSVLVIDVDNMKVINDGLDFETGNLFIAGLAQRLVASVRDTALVARLSGDSFAVLESNAQPQEIHLMANRLVEKLGETIRLDEISIARSVSIGVSHRHDPADDRARTEPHPPPAVDLLAEASAALHQAKLHGKKQVAVFDEQMRSRVLDRFEVEIELRQAIERGEFTLHYQPEVNLDTGEIRAVEALVRWDHPRRGMLTAGAFIQTAEESGLVVEIGDTVLRQAIGQLAQWQGRFPELEMWINISPAQLMSRDLAAQIEQLVEEFGVNPGRICLEVTEHVVLGDLGSSTGVLQKLRSMGVKLALDDFGTGYSSMKQLKQLPINTLKIDMTFVAGLGISVHDSAIVDAAITLATAFGLDTVAEGVETPQQIEELLSRGCAHAQGFLLARPGPPDLVGKLLEKPLVIEDLVEL